MDWKEMLGQLRDDPSLPAGEDQVEVADTSSVTKDSLRVIVDRKGRKGKVATIIEGFTIGDDEVADVAAMLKRKLGVGGSSRGGEILIQGDASVRVRELLIKEGYKVKKS